MPAARPRLWGAEFSLYTTASKKSIGKLHKKSCLGSPEIVQLFERKFLTSGACGGILFTEVKGKRFLKRRKATVKKLPKKTSKNLLTSQAKSAIMKAQGNPMYLEKLTSHFGIKLPKV